MQEAQIEEAEELDLKSVISNEVPHINNIMKGIKDRLNHRDSTSGK